MALAATAAATLGVAACGTSGGGGNSAEGGTLTVWLMDGSASEEMISALNQEFEAAHPGVKVKYEVQAWNGIQDKLTTSLTSDNPPDIIELGNTQNPQFSSQDTLTDLTDSAKDFNQDKWIPGLAEAGKWNGKQYGIPFYAANRVVLYRTDLFQAAGITATPTSNAEWLDAIAKLKAANAADPDFQPLYLPGQYWYALTSFIWDQGGDLATGSGGSYTGALDTPQAQAGVEFYKQLVEASGTTAPKDNDEAHPQQADVYAAGKVGMWIGMPGELATAVKTDPSLKEKTSAFPIPSKDAGKTAPVFLGGSNLAIPASAAHVDAAKDWLKLLTSDKYQTQLAKGGFVPGADKDTTALAGDPVSAAMAKATAGGKATPVTPAWASIEAGQNPLKDMLTAVLTGAKTVPQATKDANDALTKALAK
ncbi:N,N'-diacetylchitobiose transport system substrate-binding protein [Goodfellowiella coeruleoviolacea]|uniref:N,N'-diacetylchitobiose transport system substrate-binding protein n=1 Tax=Goodfellowiella coeruleoviolacea TaxID=334858 RepID=A0AAE3GAN5_9PSEU|nr:N,N'-diacetylchitobiose transport system substrate-binding protein [Goodfellowiella coeruleoviolacea]